MLILGFWHAPARISAQTARAQAVLFFVVRRSTGDRRRIAPRRIGVPTTAFGVGMLPARATAGSGIAGPSPAWLLWGLAVLWYFSGGHPGIGQAVRARPVPHRSAWPCWLAAAALHRG